MKGVLLCPAVLQQAEQDNFIIAIVVDVVTIIIITFPTSSKED